MKKKIEERILIPEDIEVNIGENTVSIKLNDKSVERHFNLKNLEIKKENKEIVIKSNQGSKKESKMIGTIKAHLQNMMSGLKEPFEYKLAIEYLHFPITVEMDKENNRVIIKNFLGEKKPRYSNIVLGADININKNEIIIKSYDKEIAGQCAANLEKATKVKGKDRRKFQDGIYITEKAGKKI